MVQHWWRLNFMSFVLTLQLPYHWNCTATVTICSIIHLIYSELTQNIN
jgi:hypothetical protein